MSGVAVYDNEFITVKYLPDKKVISHTVHKPLEPRLWLEALNAGTDAMIKYGACKWLSDDRNRGPLSDDEDMQKGSEDWTERTLSSGWKYWAAVVPTDVVSAGSMITAMDYFHQRGLRMMVFDNVEKALEWLGSL